MNSILLFAAVLPVVVLCYFIYKKDNNKESPKLLRKIFIFGFFSFIPILICEEILTIFFPIDNNYNLVSLFFNMFISVALVEEGFKWLVTKFIGYNNKEFDEIYDIIVYSVFASLGFACIENILYVSQYGFVNAIMRAVLSIPGHMCFAVAMGCFLAKAKIVSQTGNKGLYSKNMLLSIIVPSLLHSAYDTFLGLGSGYILLFLIFDIIMVVFCFIKVDKVSKMQVNIVNNVNDGVLKVSENGNISYNIDNSVINDSPQVLNSGTINFCPCCGSKVSNSNFCPYCGLKLK